MKNQKFVQTVIWVLVILIVAGLVLPAITSMFGIF